MEYQEVFSRVYQNEWGSYPIKFAEKLLTYFQETKINTALDLCCGTGHLTRELAKQKIKCTGIDLSPHQVKQATKNRGKLNIKYHNADVTKFSLGKKFDLITCTYDSLNHLKDEKALNSCFHCVKSHLNEGGHFVFDLNTEMHLKTGWDKAFNITHNDNLFMLMSGQFLADQKRALTRLTGFNRKGKSNLFEKFDEKIFNTAFSMKRVLSLLKKNGLNQIKCYSSIELTNELKINELEKQRRIFFVTKQ